MDKIEHFRQELVAKRKQSQKSHKAVKESASVLPTRSETKCTKAEVFKFETDARIKSHPMETRHDARTPNFKGNLRKYVGSPVSFHWIPTHLNQIITTPMANLTDFLIFCNDVQLTS